MSLPIALQVYSVREDASADLRGTLEKIKDIQPVPKDYISESSLYNEFI